MDTGQVTARLHSSGRALRIRWEQGTIIRLDSLDATPEMPWIAPPILDVQLNGYHGADFQSDALESKDLIQATRAFRADGGGRFLLTLITDRWLSLTSRLRRLASLRAQSNELRSAIVGWHVEGPFLSAEPGFHGAHDPNLMLDPLPRHIQELRRITGNDPLLLTIAPERTGALEAIRLAASMGIKVSLGHTNASAAVLAEAVKAGATMFTHLANGCPRELDRHDNILWRVLETPGLTPSLIPDQIHVSPSAFRLFHRIMNNSVFYTTDAMAAAGANPGRYTIGKLAVEVGPDQIVRQPGKTNFAGSALRPIEGVFRAAQMLNCPWQEAWSRFSVLPSRLMGLPCELCVGARATFCILHATLDNQLQQLQVCWNG